MLVKINTILESSRIYSLPMTIMSWLVIYVFSVLGSGNWLYGLIALVGICFAHLATNVLDDYLDYKFLIKQVNFNKEEYLKNTQKTKCRYILTGIMTEKELLELACSYLFLAGLIGLFLFFKCGVGVIYYGLAGGIITLLYSLLSRFRLSEILVALAYGPVLFGGVYYVMTKTFSWDVFLLSLPTMFVTVILLYIHTVMDYEFDINEGKKTIANFFDSQLDSLIVLKILIFLAYLSPILICIFNILDWQIFAVWLTIPLAKDLYSSMKEYSINPSSIPKKKWYHFPMENIEHIKKLDAEAFMIRMYQSRNLMIYYSLILTVSIFFGMD